MALPLSTSDPIARMADSTDHDSWKHWFQLHGPRLLLCARQWTRSLADAEDVVQEAFVRYWRLQRHLASGEGAVPADGSGPLPLLLASVRRAALDRARREGRRERREESAAADAQGAEPFFEPAAGDDGRRAAIESALRRIPAEQREALVLKIWGGLTFAEVAARLDIPPDTAASRYRYGLAALRAQMNPVDCHG